MKCPYMFVESKELYNTREGYVIRRDFQECLREKCAAYSPEMRVGEVVMLEACKRTKEGHHGNDG